MRGDMSPISSRKSVPPSACSHFPLRSSIAPVNEPFTCPKSSLSMSSSGIAAQLTSTNGPCGARRRAVERRARRAPCPTPLSPVMRTRASEAPGARDLVEEARHRRARRRGASPSAASSPVRLTSSRFEGVALAREAVPLERLLERQEDALERERLLEEVVGAALDGLDRRLHGAVPGDHDDRQVEAAGAEPVEHGEAVDVRQPDVEEDGLGPRASSPKARRSASWPRPTASTA